MPEQENQVDLLAICDRVVKSGEPLNAEEWTVDYDDVDKRNVLVVTIPQPETLAAMQRLARTLIYLLDASDYVPRHVLRAALTGLPVNLNLKWWEPADA